MLMGKYLDAIQEYQNALSQKSDHTYYYNTAIAWQRIGNKALAETNMQKALDCIQWLSDKTHEKLRIKYQKEIKQIRNSDRPLVWFS